MTFTGFIGVAAPGFGFCTQPTGYSERDYTGRTTEEYGSVYGFHDLDTANCLVEFNWPRASDGAPTYARIDFARSAQIDTPDLSFVLNGSFLSANFSWGIAQVGMGTPGVGTDFLSVPRFEVQITGDQDTIGSNSLAGRGVFTNTGGTSFATAWTHLPRSSSFTTHVLPDTTFRLQISGSTGTMDVRNSIGTASASVGVSGSFLGDWNRWESHHVGGGGGNSNQGGAGEGNQYATGDILSVDPGPL